ncbi:MAG: hypothetical protein WBI82_00480 [Sphaerochaeta sp.]
MKNYDVIIIGTGQATGTILPTLLAMKKNPLLSWRVTEQEAVVSTGVVPQPRPWSQVQEMRT